MTGTISREASASLVPETSVAKSAFFGRGLLASQKSLSTASTQIGTEISTTLFDNSETATENDNICEYDISKDGDAILEFKDGDSSNRRILRFRVSSRLLAESSPYFSQIFHSLPDKTGVNTSESGIFEGELPPLPAPPRKHVCKDGKEVLKYRMPQKESNKSEALSTLFHAAHSHMLPRKINLPFLVSISEVCLNYRCTSPVEYFVEKHWLRQWAHLAEEKNDVQEVLLFVSFVFGQESLFTRLSKSFILETSHEDEIKTWPQYIKDRIIFARHDLFCQISACCTSAVEVFLPVKEEGIRFITPSIESWVLKTPPKCPKGSHTCDATNLGWLMMVFDVLGLLPSLKHSIGQRNTPAVSLKILIDQLLSFPSPPGLHDEHCDYSPVLRSAIKEIYTNFAGLTLDDTTEKRKRESANPAVLEGAPQRKGDRHSEEQSLSHISASSNMSAPIMSKPSGSSERLIFPRPTAISTGSDSLTFTPTSTSNEEANYNILLDEESSQVHGRESAEADITQEMLQERLSNGKIEEIITLLEDKFEFIAKGDFIWLNELQELGYGLSEISQLLLSEKNESPWIYFEPKDIPPASIIPEYHQQLCVHTGGQDTNIDDDTRLASASHIERPWLSSIPTDEETIHLEELCGIAGIAPNTRDVEKWIGTVNFTEAKDILTASISFTHTHEMGGSLSSSNENIFQNSLQLCSKVSKALDNLCSAIGYGQRRGMCCDSFTVLRFNDTLSSQRTIELTQIKVQSISEFQARLSSFLESCRTQRVPSNLLHSELEECSSRAKELLWQALPNRSSRWLDISMDHKINNCALATQFLCLGFASYIRAHIGAIHPFFLDSPVEFAYLFGSREMKIAETPQITASLFRLTCMDDMIQSPVLVFYEDKNEDFLDLKLTKTQQRYDLLAAPVDLVDTWGPGQFYTGKSKPALENLLLTCVVIGGGVIQPVATKTNILHWSREVEPNLNLSVTFRSTQKFRIGGGVVVNHNCQANRRERWSSFFASLQNLGTSPDYWKVTENEAGFSLLGQQFVGAQLQFNKTWTWHPGNSWKTQYLSLLDELPFSELDRPWGLQVSCCTGVARRVPLRVLVADVMPIFANNIALPPGWPTLEQRGITKVLELGGDSFKQWYDDLSNLTNSQELQTLAKRLIKHILLVLRDTGIDREHKNFLIACPQDHMVGNPITMCLPVPCENASLWAKILTDSEQCATFACMTALCFESQEHKCQKTNPWHCPSLDTAVQQLRASNEPILISQKAWNLSANTKYWIGTPDSGLQAKVIRPAGSPFTRLEISESSVPKRTRARLGVMSGLLPKMEHLRERQVDTWPAEDVLVLSSLR